MRCARGAVLRAAVCSQLLPCGSRISELCCRLPNRDAVTPFAEAVPALAAARAVECVQLGRRWRRRMRCRVRRCDSEAWRSPLLSLPRHQRVRARRHTSRFCAAACSSPTVDKDRGDSPHTLATSSPAASVQSQRLRSAAASPGRTGGGWTTPARCESENEEAMPSSATTLLSIGTPTQCVQPAHSIRLRKTVRWAGDANAFAVCVCSGGEAQPSLPGSVELAGTNLGSPSSLAESAGRRDHDQVSRCSAPLQVPLFKRRLEHWQRRAAICRCPPSGINCPVLAPCFGLWHDQPPPCGLQSLVLEEAVGVGSTDSPMRELFVTRKAEPRPPAEAAPAPAPAPEVRAVRKCEPSSSATVHASPAEAHGSLQEVAVATPVRPACTVGLANLGSSGHCLRCQPGACCACSCKCLLFGFRAHGGFAAVSVLHNVKTRSVYVVRPHGSTLRSCGLSCLRVP
jgi:hypothetical protein